MEQVIVRENPASEEARGERPTLPLPPKRDEDEQPKPGTRRAVFPLDEGDVALIFPQGMSAEGLKELGAYLDIFLKKEAKKKEGGG